MKSEAEIKAHRYSMTLDPQTEMRRCWTEEDFLAGWTAALGSERVRGLAEALEFYGIKAIHNHGSKDKTEQYWTDEGIFDHGSKAREALKAFNKKEGGENEHR